VLGTLRRTTNDGVLDLVIDRKAGKIWREHGALWFQTWFPTWFLTW
jgi:hypothetical protein